VAVAETGVQAAAEDFSTNFKTTVLVTVRIVESLAALRRALMFFA
jgi:hypothetical protein